MECLFPQLGAPAGRTTASGPAARPGGGSFVRAEDVLEMQPAAVPQRGENEAISGKGHLRTQRSSPVLGRSGGSVLSAATASELPASLLRAMELENVLRDPVKQRDLMLAESVRAAAAERQLAAASTTSAFPPQVASGGSRVAAAVPPPDGQPVRRPAAVLDLIPYPASLVSSVHSGWRPFFAGKPIISKGVLRQDIRFCNETSTGKCVIPQACFPSTTRPDSQFMASEFRLAYLNAKISQQEEAMREKPSSMRRPDSEAALNVF